MGKLVIEPKKPVKRIEVVLIDNDRGYTCCKDVVVTVDVIYEDGSRELYGFEETLRRWP